MVLFFWRGCYLDEDYIKKNWLFFVVDDGGLYVKGIMGDVVNYLGFYY